MPCRRTISATFSGGTTLGGGTVGASAGGLFEHATEPAERIERLVREVFAIYERGAAELRAIRREGDVHPRVAQDRDEFEASLSALVDTALEPLGATQHDRAVARAMVDLNTWEALRVQGLGPAESAAAIGDMLAGRVASGRAVPSSGSSGQPTERPLHTRTQKPRPWRRQGTVGDTVAVREVQSIARRRDGDEP